MAIDLRSNPDPRVAMRRLVNLSLIAHDVDPEGFGHGTQWYPRGHDDVANIGATHGWSLKTAAGVTAALSPGTEWSLNLKHADSVGKLLNHPQFGAAWDAHVRGDSSGLRSLAEQSGLAQTKTADLTKAISIAKGQDFDEALTSPKTYSFATNLFDPSDMSRVTVDYRSADLVADAMRPTKADRGIGGKRKKDGTPPQRYGDYEDFHRGAVDILRRENPSAFGDLTPNGLQAGTWVFGKTLEKRGDPSASRGDSRVGQSYQTRAEMLQQGSLSRSDHFTIGVSDGSK